MPNSIDINTLNQLLAAGDAPLLLDVRRKADYAAMPQIIEGARWCDPESIDTWSKALPADRPHRGVLRQGRLGQSVSG